MTTPFYSIIVLKQIDVPIATVQESFYQTTYHSSSIIQIEFVSTFISTLKLDIRVNSLNKILFYKNRLRKKFLIL